MVLRNPGVGRDRSGQERKAGEVNHGCAGLFKASRPHIPAVSGFRIAVVVVMPRSRNDTPASRPSHKPRSVAGRNTQRFPDHADDRRFTNRPARGVVVLVRRGPVQTTICPANPPHLTQVAHCAAAYLGPAAAYFPRGLMTASCVRPCLRQEAARESGVRRRLTSLWSANRWTASNRVHLSRAPPRARATDRHNRCSDRGPTLGDDAGRWRRGRLE